MSFAKSASSAEPSEIFLTIELTDESTVHAIWKKGMVFFNSGFSQKFRNIIVEEYKNEITRQGYWEDVYIKHLSELPMKARKYDAGIVNEFDSIDELRLFDSSYIQDTRSQVLREVCGVLSCKEEDLNTFKRIKEPDGVLRFTFKMGGETYIYDGLRSSIKLFSNE